MTSLIIKYLVDKKISKQYKNLVRDSKYTECSINDVWFKAFPTKNIGDARGYTDVSYLFIDEASFLSQQNKKN